MIDCSSLRVVFAGTPDFAAVALQALIASDHNVVGVLTQPDRPAGRGREVKAGPVKALSELHGIPVQQPHTLKDADALKALSALRCDVMVVAAYGLILPEPVLTMPSLGCLNIHASLLPRWRGAAPIQRAILAGDSETGVCIMQMDAGLDTGDVLARATTPIGANMTGGELHDELAEIGARTLLSTLTDYCAGNLSSQPQSESGITYAEKLSKTEATLNFNEPAIALHRKVCAFNPWPVAEAVLDNVRYRIRRSAVVDEQVNNSNCTPGQVLGSDNNRIRIVTGDGLLDVLEIQKPGKKSMSASDFCRGTDLTDQVFN